MNQFKHDLIETVMTAIASYKDEKNALDQIAKFILDKGVDVIFEEDTKRFGQVLATLQPVQIMTFAKRFMKEMVRATYYKQLDIQRELNAAVAYGGVNGDETPLVTSGIDGVEIDPYETFNEYRTICEDMYPSLSAAFTAASNIVLRGQTEPLPWYTVATDDGKGYTDCFSYEDAEQMIDRAREKAAEERNARNKESLQALASLAF
jgi:hypothetical protein